jgi:hypothetical protein
VGVDTGQWSSTFSNVHPLLKEEYSKQICNEHKTSTK